MYILIYPKTGRVIWMGKPGGVNMYNPRSINQTWFGTQPLLYRGLDLGACCIKWCLRFCLVRGPMLERQIQWQKKAVKWTAEQKGNLKASTSFKSWRLSCNLAAIASSDRASSFARHYIFMAIEGEIHSGLHQVLQDLPPCLLETMCRYIHIYIYIYIQSKKGIKNSSKTEEDNPTFLCKRANSFDSKIYMW